MTLLRITAVLSVNLCCPAANPTLLDFNTFKDQVLAPFILSAEQHDQACHSSMTHDSAHPGPEEIDSMELNLSGGASEAGQKQQQQPVPVQKPQQHSKW